MSSQEMNEVEEVLRCLRSDAPTVFQSFLMALLIWLFGTLVFIPTANIINWRVGLFCSLIIFTAFTIFVFRALPGFKRTIDAFSTFPARKYGEKLGISRENSVTFFRHIFYIISSLILYAFYFPILITVHPAVSGVVLILVLIWVFSLLLRVLSLIFPKFLEWLAK